MKTIFNSSKIFNRTSNNYYCFNINLIKRTNMNYFTITKFSSFSTGCQILGLIASEKESIGLLIANDYVKHNLARYYKITQFQDIGVSTSSTMFKIDIYSDASKTKIDHFHILKFKKQLVYYDTIHETL